MNMQSHPSPSLDLFTRTSAHTVWPKINIWYTGTMVKIQSRKYLTKKAIPGLYDETRGKVEDALQPAERKDSDLQYNQWIIENYYILMERYCIN